MRDYTARKRLKKKMLDRWENEGGKVATAPITPDKDEATDDSPSKSKQVSASNDNSTSGLPASPPKRKKPTRK